METWRNLLSSYPDDPKPRDYAKAIRSADEILAEDLASFETEWLSHTLLFKPIGLFATITTKRTSDDWLKAIADSFKILAKIVDKCWPVVEDCYSEIIELCMLPFDSQTRKEAILCLISVVKHPTVDISDDVVTNHIAALEDAKSCKAPLSQLVGTICRYHPEKVQDHFKRVWRIYLSMLQPNSKTDQVVSSVLQGINGLFEHFGDELEIVQLNAFYDKLSREYVKISKCLDVLLSILKNHARLFKERLSKDSALRMYLWQIDTKQAMDAVNNVYEVVLPEVGNNEVILKSEVLPKTQSECILIRHTALRIMIQAKSSLSGVPSVTSGIDLEFKLRAKKLSYEEAHTVSYCIGSGINNSETMLLNAIMFYDNLPPSKRGDIVVNGILKASDDVRKAALVLLLKQSLQDNIDKYLDVWRSLLDNTTGPDLAKAVLIFEDAMHYILEVLAACAEGTEKVYAEIHPFISIMSVILSLHKVEFHTEDWCSGFGPSIVHLARKYGLQPLEILTGNSDKEILYVEKFQEDTVLSSLLSTLNKNSISDNTLSTFQTIFSTEDIDFNVLTKALYKIETVINNENNNLDKHELSMLINQISKLKSKNVVDNKVSRTFQKNVTEFLGKYGHLMPEEKFSDDTHVLKLENKITFNVPNIIQGTVLKIDLQRIFQLCLMWEDSEALYSLLVILTANLCDRADPGLQEATIRIIHSIFKADASKKGIETCVYPALLMCNTVPCVQRLMEALSGEICPNIRRRLSDSLQILLTHEPGSEKATQLLKIVAEQVVFMMSRDEAIISGLDITRAFLSALNDNNSFVIEYLPKMLPQISRYDSEIFEMASNMFIEKIDLFVDSRIEEILIEIIDIFSTKNLNSYTILNNILGFMKRVVVIKNFDGTKLVDYTLNSCKNLTIISPQFLNLVTLLASFNTHFNLNIELRRKIVIYDNCVVLQELLKLDEKDHFKINAVLMFLKEYAVELKEIHFEKSLKCLGKLLENIPPNSVLPLKNILEHCFTAYKIDSKLPDTIVESYKNWLRIIDLQNITVLLNGKALFPEFTDNISEIIHAVRLMSDLCDVPIDMSDDWICQVIFETSDLEKKWGKLFLSDLLALSGKDMPMIELEEILYEHMNFVKTYINVFFKRIMENPFILNEEKYLRESFLLVIDIVDYFSKNYEEKYFQNVMDFVNHTWSIFEEESSLDDKISVLLNLLRLPKKVDFDCLALKWGLTLLSTEGTSLEDKIKLIGVLPAGEEYSTYYKQFASSLPVRLSEMSGQYAAPFRALLDSLAANGDMTVLNIVLTLAAGDETTGWWDNAIEASMAILAAKENTNIFDEAYIRAKSGHTMSVCNRTLLPLLRHCSRKFCEEFISSKVSDLFNILKVGFKEPANNEVYRKRVVSYAIAFNILRVAFERLTAEALEIGRINEGVGGAGVAKPWNFLEQTCKYCVTVSRTVKCPPTASVEVRNTCLWLQCSSYNCLTTAICRRKLSKNLSGFIFNCGAWASIVDTDAEYKFDLKAYSKYTGGKPTKRSVDAIATSSTFTGTVRSKLFLTTLSENPLQFDMIPVDEDEEEEEEDDSTVEFEDSMLNKHGCLTALTSVLEHASTSELADWRAGLATALTNDLTVNAKWLLAQAICNAEESLKPHAGDLCPALLELISKTPVPSNGTLVLHNLHIDILTTITKWNYTDLTKNQSLNLTMEYLINTCVIYKNNSNIHRRLLNVLNGVLQLYGKIVEIKWSVFQNYCQDPPKDIIRLLPILERLLRNGVYLPDFLPITLTFREAKMWSNASKLAEVCGLALSLTDAVTRDNYLSKFAPILTAVRSVNVTTYVKVLFYLQRSCKQCCDFTNFKIITDLSTKVEKSKCLSIISTYLENATEFDDYFNDMYQIISLVHLLDSELRVEAMKIAENSLKFMKDDMKCEILKGVVLNCRSSSVNVRREAFCFILKAFKDLFKPQDEHPSKRQALDSSSILNIINSNNDYEKTLVQMLFDGIFDRDSNICTMMSDGVQECLAKDLCMRFAELFYIIVYQCSLSRTELDLSTCGSKFLEMLFSDLRSQDSFKIIKLRDTALPQSIFRAYEAPSTKTLVRTIQKSGVTYRQKHRKAPTRREIDIQMPITDILGVFLQLSKTNFQACQELLIQTMKCLQGTSRRFDLEAIISRQLYDVMRRGTNCLTPIVLDACRVFVKDISGIQGFKESVETLMLSVKNSEGYLYTSVLYEDLLLRSSARNLFVFNMFKEDSDAVMADQEFSLKGLIDTFGLLSNWDDLRIQEKREIEASLPPLWSSNDNFTILLREYFEGVNKKLDYGVWFNKMVACYYEEEVMQDKFNWLKQTEKWPRRDFVTSAVLEATEWHKNDAKIIGEINSSDCLAEWSARLMIRSAYKMVSQNSDSDTQMTNVCKNELLWCKETNRRELPKLALQCIRRNIESLSEEEILPWIQEKVQAYRIIGLKENNTNIMLKALEAAEKQMSRFALQADLETNISMQKLILQLNHDLGSLSKTKLDDIIQDISRRIIVENVPTQSSKNAQILKNIYEIAMTFYDDHWTENDESTQNSTILGMTDLIDKVLDFSLTQDYNLLFSLILNRLAYCKTTVIEKAAEMFLKQIHRVYRRFDSFTVAILKKIIPMLPASVLKDSYLEKLEDNLLDECKQYFQVICDANYALLQYCTELRRNVLDDGEWNKTFNLMKSRLFETKFGGSDYQSLNTIKNKLYALENMTDIDGKAKALLVIIEELSSKPIRNTLLVSQLCPSLCSADILETRRTQLQKILRLPANVYIVKFYEQVSVFTDSVRRPCVLKALLSNGVTVRYMCKSGEPMLRDASVQRAAAILCFIEPSLNITSYNVTPLSEASAIIEYLEDHVRLRDLMEEQYDIDSIAVNRKGHEKLILSPSLAIEQYNEMCDKVTPYILRSAIENKCACVMEFITKKRTFEDTLSSMTIFNWLFGVGDRHLQNIMYSLRLGSVCGVDWASIFQYGCLELPPARLTANLLAVCDIKVFESRLQAVLSSLRNSRKLFEAFIKISFYWMEPNFDKLKHINNILEGKTVSFEINRECIDESNRKYKNEYIQLLDRVFENFSPKEMYSVEEQVSCLLQHCTEPRILAVTPPGWEAWL